MKPPTLKPNETMRQHIKDRNERIRKEFIRLSAYYRRIGERKPADKAIQQLLHKYSAYELSYDYMAQICRTVPEGEDPGGKKEVPEGGESHQEGGKQAEDAPDQAEGVKGKGIVARTLDRLLGTGGGPGV